VPKSGITKKPTACISNLYTGLADMDGDDFTHSIADTVRYYEREKHDKMESAPYFWLAGGRWMMGEGLKLGA
jgi:hypothetical protein